MLNIIAAGIAAYLLAERNATRESKAHAMRKAQRMQREATQREEHQAQRSMRDRNEYPFHV